jgi:hypothetical protein
LFYSPTLQLYIIYITQFKLNSQMGAYDIEDAMTWKKKIELIIDQV